MEIYSYVCSGSSAVNREPRVRKMFQKDSVARKIQLEELERTESKATARKIVLTPASNGKKRFLFAFFALIICCFVPKSVFFALNNYYNHISHVDFPIVENEFEILNAKMSEFAMAESFANIDENGNVISADGTVISPSLFIDKAVTFQTYTVKSGDTISSIALKFGLRNISTLVAVNDISNVRTLRAGQKLRIPSMDGLIYKVKSGDSLNSLSVKYNLSVEELLDSNDLSSDSISAGDELFIPGAKMDSQSLKKAMGELFTYPIKASWRLTSQFGYRKDPFTGIDSSHTGVDMACPTGTPIFAALSGTVVKAGWSNIFGNYVIISHGNGYQTLYGHMVKYLVKKGQYVDQSTKIGLVGSTGYSTGPHLHFTVYKNGKLVDPMSLLKK